MVGTVMRQSRSALCNVYLDLGSISSHTV